VTREKAKERCLQPGKAGRREEEQGEPGQASQQQRAAGQLSRVIDDIDLVYTPSTHPDIIHTQTHKHTQNDGFPLSISPRQGLRDRLRRQGPSPSTYTATAHSRNTKLTKPIPLYLSLAGPRPDHLALRDLRHLDLPRCRQKVAERVGVRRFRLAVDREEVEGRPKDGRGFE
jgi:hypothetical protein